MFSLQMCRICEKQSNLVDISNDQNYIDHYLIVANVSYHVDDGLPQYFCENCITQLLYYVNFQQKCEETYKKLYDLKAKLQSSRVKNENDYELVTVELYEYDNSKSMVFKTETEDINSSLSESETYASKNADWKNFYRPRQRGELKCDMCTGITRFGSIYAIESHMLKSHRMKVNLRQCEVCGNNSEWLTPEKFKRHEHNKQISINYVRRPKPKTNDPKKLCEICSATFSYDRSLKRHIDDVHKKIKLHQCDICKKSFAQKMALVTHISGVHLNQHKYICNVCGERFKHIDSMKRCENKHLPENERKPVRKYYQKRPPGPSKPFVSVCKVCNKVLASSLTNHMKTHNGEKLYKCDYCDRRFAIKCQLKNHLRTHTGEKPYKCNYCDKTFSQNINCVTHIRLHTGERPFICQECGKGSICLNSLKRHRKNCISHAHKRTNKC